MTDESAGELATPVGSPDRDGDGLPECDYGFHLFLRFVISARMMPQLVVGMALTFVYSDASGLVTPVLLLLPCSMLCEAVCYWGIRRHMTGEKSRVALWDAMWSAGLGGWFAIAAFAVDVARYGGLRPTAGYLVTMAVIVASVVHQPLAFRVTQRISQQMGMSLPFWMFQLVDWRCVLGASVLMAIGPCVYLYSMYLDPGPRALVHCSWWGHCVPFFFVFSIMLLTTAAFGELAKRLRKYAGTGLTPEG